MLNGGGNRKPDPRFFQLALDLLGVRAEETVFLDDIGHNLAAARKLGIKTIRTCDISLLSPQWKAMLMGVCRAGVRHGKSSEAIRELEETLGMDLSSGRGLKL